MIFADTETGLLFADGKIINIYNIAIYHPTWHLSGVTIRLSQLSSWLPSL